MAAAKNWSDWAVIYRYPSDEAPPVPAENELRALDRDVAAVVLEIARTRHELDLEALVRELVMPAITRVGFGPVTRFETSGV